MPLPADIDKSAVSIVVDENIHHPLGTGFYFLQTKYFITAKHVVVDHGTGNTRDNLVLMQRGPDDYPSAAVKFLHPYLDLAVLEITQPACTVPLYPSHERIIGQHGLQYWGYAPSRSDKNTHEYGVVVAEIPRYELERRERQQGDEQVLKFKSPFIEGGYSGGPVLAIGGGVVAVIIEGHRDWAHATDIHGLMPYVEMHFPTDG